MKIILAEGELWLHNDRGEIVGIAINDLYINSILKDVKQVQDFIGKQVKLILEVQNDK